MVATVANSESKGSNKKRDRRHWHDEEKLEIIKKFEADDLLSVPGNPDFVTDPKSKKELAKSSIIRWKASFIDRGILKDTKSKVLPTVETGRAIGVPIESKRRPALTQSEAIAEEDNVQSLLIKVLMENQKLKRALDGRESRGLKQASL